MLYLLGPLGLERDNTCLEIFLVVDILDIAKLLRRMRLSFHPFFRTHNVFLILELSEL